MVSETYESLLPAPGPVAKAVGNNLANHPDDVRKVKRALEVLNILNPQDDPVPDAGIMTDRVRQGIRMFQRDHDLPDDGEIRPGGKTALRLDETIKMRSAKGETFGPPAPPQTPAKPAPVFRPYPPVGVVPARKPEVPILSKVPNKEVKDFIRGFEDGKNFLYKDTKGNVTTLPSLSC